MLLFGKRKKNFLESVKEAEERSRKERLRLIDLRFSIIDADMDESLKENLYKQIISLDEDLDSDNAFLNEILRTM